MLFVASACSFLTLWLLWGTQIPLGFPGEWVWNRVSKPPESSAYLVPVIVTAGYTGFIFWVWRLLSHRSERWSLVTLPLLVTAGGGLQMTYWQLPQAGFGLERAPLSLHSEATSGYLTHARTMDWQQLIPGYDEWIQEQDSFHTGTHPPGLFWLNRALLDYFNDHPESGKHLVRLMPERFVDGYRLLQGTPWVTPQEQATVAAVAILTWLGALATVFPIYGLARFGASPETAWAAASFWPLTPAILAFYPVSDCLFGFLSASIVALSVWASTDWKLLPLALLAGVLLCVSMLLTLAFLVTIPLLTLAIFTTSGTTSKTGGFGLTHRLIKTTSVVVTGLAGFVGALCWFYFILDLPLITVWLTNLDKHAGFYQAMPRSYWPWVGINLIEFAIASGPALFVLSVVSAATLYWQRTSRLRWFACCWIFSLLVVDFTGKNLSEVARLWIFLTPFACVCAAGAMKKSHGLSLLCVLGLQAAVSLAVLGTVEPLLPFAIP